MCVIINKEPGVIFPEDDIDAALQNNPDGFGVMWVEKGKVRTFHLLKATVEEIMDIQYKLKDKLAVMHFRFTTHGSTSIENVHPFPVCTMKEDGIDIYMAHNGTISGVTEIKDESDTRAFIREIVRPILLINPDILYLPSFHKLLDEFIDWSKLSFLTSDGQVVVVNEGSGCERHGCWVSNDYSFDAWHRYGSYNYGSSYTPPTTARKASPPAWEEDENAFEYLAKAKGYDTPVKKSPTEKEYISGDMIATIEMFRFMSNWEKEIFCSEYPDLAREIIDDLIYS